MNSFSINETVKNPSRINSSAGYAYFPATGPAFKSCGECVFAFKSGANTHCRKWQILKKLNKRGPAIAADSDACKYFEGKGA